MERVKVFGENYKALKGLGSGDLSMNKGSDLGCSYLGCRLKRESKGRACIVLYLLILKVENYGER